MTHAVWRNLSIALGAEPREYPVVTGSSGLEHHFLSIAVDDRNKRLILVSPDPDPRMAALTHVDVQTAMPGLRVLIARPIILDLGVLARQLVNSLGTERLNLLQVAKQIEKFGKLPKKKQERYLEKYLGASVERMASAFQHVTLPALAQIVSVIQQAANLDWHAIHNSIEKKSNNIIIPLGGLVAVDNLAIDRRHGVCPFPLYSLSDQDWSMLNSSDDISAIRARLEEMGVYEYFFPHADEVALGFVDRGMGSIERIEAALQQTSDLGHPFSGSRLLDTEQGIQDVVYALTDAGFLVHGELGLEVSPEGKTFRSLVKFQPKESLISKILSRCNISFDATKLLH